MSEGRLRTRWLGLPIAAQILGLLLGGLVIAQITTLGLTLLIPPASQPQHDLAEIAGALRGGPLGDGPRPLVRTVDTLPPSLQSPGWLVSQRSTTELARLLHAPQSDVRLLFYAPPPFAGAAPAQRAELRPPPRLDASGGIDRSLLVKVDYEQGGPPGGGFGDRGGPGGFPGSPGRPGGSRSDTFPDHTSPNAPPAPRGATAETRGAETRQDTHGGRSAETHRATEGPTQPAGEPRAMQEPKGPGGGWMGPPHPRTALEAAVFAPVTRAPEPPPREPAEPAAIGEQKADDQVLAAMPPANTVPVPPTSMPTPASAEELANLASSGPSRTLAPPTAQGLFGAQSTPQVEGEFVAALRVAPGQWVTVRPKPESFPNSWQRRILLWFAVAFAAVAPVGYLFARRLAAPLRDFALASEALGRDPQAIVSATEGPAEIGRAARAFNLMQARLRRYIEDRTGMIGAISHDLRTPLARMRFRLERAPPDLKAAMSRDIAQMEDMITSVLTFMRDDTASGRRDRVDLRSVLECVVDDACAAGDQAELEPGPPIEVEVDLLGVQRVFENLVGNAVKYGERAKVRIYALADEAVAEVEDTGPGLPDSELEQVFKPFYRGVDARSSTKGGMGLGLAVSRATVRGHGGDLQLRRGPCGLVAEVRLPLPPKTKAGLAA